MRHKYLGAFYCLWLAINLYFLLILSSGPFSKQNWHEGLMDFFPLMLEDAWIRIPITDTTIGYGIYPTFDYAKYDITEFLFYSILPILLYSLFVRGYKKLIMLTIIGIFATILFHFFIGVVYKPLTNSQFIFLLLLIILTFLFYSLLSARYNDISSSKAKPLSPIPAIEMINSQINIYQRIVLLSGLIALWISYLSAPHIHVIGGTIYRASEGDQNNRVAIIEWQTAALRVATILGSTTLLYFALKDIRNKEE